ncbi:MAG: hemin-degrading factor [Betaproteobacteria bacterium]|nr:hemin-degrading factor [Betaproteobacteria bacterium]
MEIIRGVIEPSALRGRWEQLKAERKVRNREAASLLGVSEGQLIASLCKTAATRLDPRFPEILKSLQNAGRTMALTRNEACVHERVGVYEDVSHEGPVGLVLGPDIDLRIFYRGWSAGFAVDESHDGGPGRSLQFFDKHGQAIHKIYMRDEGARGAWEQVSREFAFGDQSGTLAVETYTPPVKNLRPDEAVDVPGFRKAWAGLQDTHDFFGMLKKFDVARTQAMRLADRQFACPVPLDAPTQVLRAAAESGVPIMVFVGNPGCIQIHTGAVKNVQAMGPWINVMDPEFNLHLRQDLVAEAWVVRKPTVDGIVTSLEIFDSEGELIAQFFGARKPGIPEKAEWRDLLDATFPALIGTRQ